MRIFTDFVTMASRIVKKSPTHSIAVIIKVATGVIMSKLAECCSHNCITVVLRAVGGFQSWLLSRLSLTFFLAFPLMCCKFKLLKQEDCKRKARRVRKITARPAVPRQQSGPVCPSTLPVHWCCLDWSKRILSNFVTVASRVVKKSPTHSIAVVIKVATVVVMSKLAECCSLNCNTMVLRAVGGYIVNSSNAMKSFRSWLLSRLSLTFFLAFPLMCSKFKLLKQASKVVKRCPTHSVAVIIKVATMVIKAPRIVGPLVTRIIVVKVKCYSGMSNLVKSPGFNNVKWFVKILAYFVTGTGKLVKRCPTHSVAVIIKVATVVIKAPRIVGPMVTRIIVVMAKCYFAILRLLAVPCVFSFSLCVSVVLRLWLVISSPEDRPLLWFYCVFCVIAAWQCLQCTVSWGVLLLGVGRRLKIGPRLEHVVARWVGVLHENINLALWVEGEVAVIQELGCVVVWAVWTALVRGTWEGVLLWLVRLVVWCVWGVRGAVGYLLPSCAY